MELAREWDALGCDKVVAMRPSERAEYDSSPNEAQRHVAIPSSFPPLMRSTWLFDNCAILGVRSASSARFGERPSLRVRRHPRMTPCPKTDSMRERAYRHRTPRRFAPNNQNASREPPQSSNTLTHPSVARKGPPSEVRCAWAGKGITLGKRQPILVCWYLFGTWRPSGYA
jgi:hypothetical protein